MTDEFRYGHRRNLHGHTWYCQTRGQRWATDPDIAAWVLTFTNDTSWWLIGPDQVATDMSTRKLTEAMATAADHIRTHTTDQDSEDTEDSEFPRRCACHDYEAQSATDLDEHILAMMQVLDGSSHA